MVSVQQIIFLVLMAGFGLTEVSAQSIKITKHDDSVQRGQNSSVSVKYESPVDAIIQIQLFTADWKRQSQETVKVSAGSGSEQIEIAIPAELNDQSVYLWQAVLSDRAWKKLAEVTATDIRITGGVVKGIAKPTQKPPVVDDAKPVEVAPSGNAEGLPEGTKQWVPAGDWTLDWADEFSGKGMPEKWYPLIGYNHEAYKTNTRKGIRWTGGTEESARMYSEKTGMHILNGLGQLVMRIVCDKTKENEHGPIVKAAYLLSGYPEAWEKTEQSNVRWAGKFVSPADGPLYISCRARTDQVIGYSTWFAFWLFTETRAYNGNPVDGTEVDIIEIPKGQPDYMKHSFNVANHWKETGGSESKQFNAASRPRPEQYVNVNDSQYHTYGALWSTDSIRCYVDGKLYYEFTENIPSDPVDMMMLLTLEFQPNAWDRKQGDGRTEGPFIKDTPAQREMSRVLVDHVRVYRKIR